MGTEDEALFAGKTGTGMEVGAVVNGNLRLKVDLADGSLAVVELPHRWLVGRGGLLEFVKHNCHPGGPAPFRCDECRNGDCNECCVIDGFRGSCQCSCAGGPVDNEANSTGCEGTKEHQYGTTATPGQCPYCGGRAA